MYHLWAGSILVVEWGIILYLYAESMMENLHSDGCRRSWDSAALDALNTFRLNVRAMPFSWGWWGMVVVCVVPIAVRKICTCCVVNSFAVYEYNSWYGCPWYCEISVRVFCMWCGTYARVMVGMGMETRLFESIKVRIWWWPTVHMGVIRTIVSLDNTWTGWEE